MCVEWKWPVVKYEHIKLKPRICVLFLFLCLTWTVNANSLKQNIIVIKEICFLSCHLGWMNRRRFCLQKGGNQEHISLITIMFCFHEFAFTVQGSRVHPRACACKRASTCRHGLVFSEFPVSIMSTRTTKI